MLNDFPNVIVRFLPSLLLLAGVLSGQANCIEQPTNQEDSKVFRRPVGIAISDDGQHAFVANRCGSVTVIDLTSQQVLNEMVIGEQLSDIRMGDGGKLYVCDRSKHEVIVLGSDSASVAVDCRIKVPRYPVRIAIDETTRHAYVTSLWSRRVCCIELSRDWPRLLYEIDLDFAPREIVVTDHGKALIGDAFGGKLAVLDMKRKEIVVTHHLPAHNIQGIAIDPQTRQLIVSHQILAERSPTIRADVHWGMIMSNDLRWLKLDQVTNPAGNLFKQSHIHGLGEPDNAAADPASIAVSKNGTIVVALSGVDQVAFGREGDFQLQRRRVGNRPVAVALDPSHPLAYVANTLSDSISVVNLTSGVVQATISLGPQPVSTPEVRGESLFFDGRLSHNGWMSCHSCHTEGHTNGLLNDNLSDGSFGAPKRILSLLGAADTAPYAWNAEVDSLETQIRNSIHKTMVGDRNPTDRDVDDLAAYLRTLAAPPSLSGARQLQVGEANASGAHLFREQKCARCHKPGSFTTPRTYHVGLVDEVGNRRFNPPSLRGVSQRGPYFHDNSVDSLIDVFRLKRHQLRSPLTPAELADLTAFLSGL